MMKRYALRFTSGQHKGKFVGDKSTSGSRVSVSIKNPRIWTSTLSLGQYLRSPSIEGKEVEIVPLWLLEEDQLPFEVHIMEYERGFGSRHEGTKRFPTLKEAEAFCEDYNKDNTESSVPDYYWVAQIVSPRRSF